MGFRNPIGAKTWVDKTQYGHVAGKLGADAWSQIFLAASEAAKTANPHVLLGGPSAPSFEQDDFGAHSSGANSGDLHLQLLADNY